MLRSSSTITNATTSTSNLYSPTLTERFPVPTPPPSSSSPVELAPILDICDSLVDNRPPSPDSPKLKMAHHEQDQVHTLPAYLEPTPQFVVEPISSLIFPLQLFTLYPKQQVNRMIPAKSNTAVQIPIARRKSQTPARITISLSANHTSLGPMSPTLAAAYASAAAAADHRHPGSQVAKSLLKSISSTGNKRMTREDENEFAYHHAPITEVKHQHMSTSNQNNSLVDQSMFLTKNAHIKRPRNAWIHFRCHYGQALKAQDPTLRAEEISKRASRRWGKLTENEKKPWHGLAEQEKLAHREAFPEYRYCPRRATSTSSPSSPPNTGSNVVAVNNRVRSATTSEIDNTPIRMHDVFSIPSSTASNNSMRLHKRMKRNSK